MTTSNKQMTWKGNRLRGILFDMDGVIADTRDAHKQAWVRYLKTNDHDLDLEGFMVANFGRGNREIFSELHPDEAHNPQFLDSKGHEKEQHFLDIFHEGHVKPIPGLHEFIDFLVNHGIKMAAGSSAPIGNLTTVLEGFGISKFFEVIVSGSDVEHAKPDPEIFNRCREGLQLEAAECIVLEDSNFGIQAARNAGCHVIGLATTHPRHEIEPICDAVVDDYYELLELLG